MTCKHCGYVNNDNDVYCALCAAKLEKDTVEAAAYAQPVQNDQQAYQPQYQQPQPQYQQPQQPQQQYQQPQPQYQQPQQQYQQQYQQPYVQPVAPQNPGSGLGTASLVLGIISMLLCNPMFICSFIAIICGGVGKKKSKEAGMKNGTATAGITLGMIPIIISTLAVIAYVVIAIFMIATMGFDEFMWTMEEIFEEFFYIIEDVLYEMGIY